jgi:hypothetical protein
MGGVPASMTIFSSGASCMTSPGVVGDDQHKVYETPFDDVGSKSSLFRLNSACRCLGALDVSEKVKIDVLSVELPAVSIS